MLRGLSVLSAVVLGVSLVGCATAPTAPTVLALPGKNKTFAQFQQDDFNCRNYAQSVIGGTTPGQANANSAVGGAAVGTVVGAAAGALLGAAAGNAGAGAAIGAGSGLLLGTGIGASNGQAAGASLQQRYDFGYIQCMTANGENIQTVAAPAPYPAAYPAYVYGYPPYSYPTYAYPPVVVPQVSLGFGFFGGRGGYYGHRGYWGH